MSSMPWQHRAWTSCWERRRGTLLWAHSQSAQRRAPRFHESRPRGRGLSGLCFDKDRADPWASCSVQIWLFCLQNTKASERSVTLQGCSCVHLHRCFSNFQLRGVKLLAGFSATLHYYHYFLWFSLKKRRQLLFCASLTVFINVKREMYCFMTLAVVLYLVASLLMSHKLFHS